MPPGCPKRPRQETEMLNHILQSLDHIVSKHPATGIIVTGDFNHMKDATLKRFPLKQVVKTPTHRDGILDCIYTNLGDYYSVPTVSPGVGLSRHRVVSIRPKIVTLKKESFVIHTRVNTKEAKAAFTQGLSQVNWTPLYRAVSCH